jgi:hypothetical protein
VIVYALYPPDVPFVKKRLLTGCSILRQSLSHCSHALQSGCDKVH